MADENNDDILEGDGSLDVDAASAIIDATLNADDAARDDDGETKDDTTDSTAKAADADTSRSEPEGEIPAEGDAAEAAEEAADGEDDGDWFATDDVRDLAASLGLSEEDVQGMSGPDELSRYATFLDRQLIQDGKQFFEQAESAQTEESGDTTPTPSERAKAQPRDKGRFTRQQEPVSEGDYAPELNADEFDDAALVNEFKRLNSHQQSRLQALEEQLTDRFEQRLAQLEERDLLAQHAQELATFDAMVDSLDQGDLFGKTGEFTQDSEAFKARQKLFDIQQTLRAGMRSRNLDAALNPSLLRRALHQGFAQDLIKQERKALSDRVRRQSKKRLGGPSRKPTKDTVWTGEPEDDPVLHEHFNRLAKEGAA